MGSPEGTIFERQTKATLEVKTRHFVTTFESVQFSLHQGRKVKLQHFLSRTLFDTHHVRDKQRTVFLTSGWEYLSYINFSLVLYLAHHVRGKERTIFPTSG